MSFQIKDFSSIVASMLNRMRNSTTKITDYNIGSVARTLIEAPAVEIDELYQQMFNGLMDAIPVATYNSFDFGLIGAIPASGIIRVSITAQPVDTLITAGTAFVISGNPYSYISSEDIIIESGDTTNDVPAAANVAGSATNIPVSSVFTATPLPNGFVSATNIAAWNNGTDQETEDQRKSRFSQFIQALPRGTVAALEFGAKTAALYDANGVEIERVKSVAVIEPWIDDDLQPISLVNLYIHNGVGSTSGALVTQTNSVIYGYYDALGKAVPGWKAAGVKVVVAAATEVPKNVTGVVTPSAGFDGPTVAALASTALATYMLGLDIGEPLQFAQAIHLVKSIVGIDNFVVSSPTSDQTVTKSQKIMPGTLAITSS